MVNITYATQNQGKCDTAVTRPSECYNAAVKLDPSMANAKFLVLDSKQFPEGCSMIHYNNGTADVVLNKRTENVEACGAGAQQWLGKWKNNFLAFPAWFQIPIIVFNLNSNCFNILDMRNLQV